MRFPNGTTFYNGDLIGTVIKYSNGRSEPYFMKWYPIHPDENSVETYDYWREPSLEKLEKAGNP